MNTRRMINWSIWIGTLTGIYVLLYLISPLGQYGIIWVTFIAVPIYFNGGAKRKDYVPQMLSSIIGVLWGLAMLTAAGGLTGLNIKAAEANAIACGVLTITCCFMMIIKDKALINKVPAMFGGISACFSQGGKNIIPLCITLCLGVSLGLLSNEGLNFLSPDGNWIWPFGKRAETE